MLVNNKLSKFDLYNSKDTATDITRLKAAHVGGQVKSDLHCSLIYLYLISADKYVQNGGDIGVSGTLRGRFQRS